MYTELCQYLLLNKELALPGVGTLQLERKSAAVDFPNKKINPPAYALKMQPGSYLPDKGFFHWLGQTLNISDREAIFRFNDFTFEMKKQLSEGGTIEWNGVGILNRGLGGDIKFIPVSELISPESPVHAEKVLRENAAHTIRVGEEEKTSAEMVEMLNQPREVKSYWWAWALALGLLAIIFTGWYFSEHGLDTSSTANTKQLVPGEAGSTYRVLP